MTTRCLQEWDESTFEVFIRSEEGFEQICVVYAYSVFSVAQKLARQIPLADYDDIHLIRAEVRGFWVITFERIADSPGAKDQIIAEYFVRKS